MPGFFKLCAVARPLLRLLILRGFLMSMILMLGASVASAQTTAPFACAGEFEFCHLPPGHDRYTVSFGSASSDPSTNGAFLITVENVPTVNCSGSFFGLPTSIAGSSCKAVPVQPLVQEDTWHQCAGGEEFCNVAVADGEYVLARYGDKATSRWIYNYVASDFFCNLDAFGYGNTRDLRDPLRWIGGLRKLDPAENVFKTCEISKVVKAIPKYSVKELETEAKKPLAIWQECGTHGSLCKMPGEGTYIVRYGVDKRWVYRTFIGTQFPCGLTSFGNDPAENVYKSCQYLKAPQIKYITGKWEPVVRCAGCSEEEFSLMVGVTKGEEKTKQSSWAVELSLTLEASAGVEGVSSSKVSSTLTTTTGGAKSISESFEKRSDKEIKVTCQKGAIYQWVTTVEDICRIGSQNCITVARSIEYICTDLSDVPGPERRVGD